MGDTQKVNVLSLNIYMDIRGLGVELCKFEGIENDLPYLFALMSSFANSKRFCEAFTKDFCCFLENNKSFKVIANDKN